MSCGNIYQKLTPSATITSITWRNDTSLPQPKLTSPSDGSIECEEPADGGVYGAESGISLDWEPVDGADFYTVQISSNPNFTGPLTRTYRVAGSNSYELLLGQDIRQGETSHWRVVAHKNDGSRSTSSEVRTLTFDCGADNSEGTRSKKGNPAGPGPKAGEATCKQWNVDMKIEGPNILFCCDISMFHLNMHWICKNIFGQEVCRLLNVTWSLIVPPQDPGDTKIVHQNKRLAVVKASCTQSQVIEIQAEAQFKVIATGQEFLCRTRKKIFIDCDAGPGPGFKKGYGKPWLYINWCSGDFNFVPFHVYIPFRTYSRTPERLKDEPDKCILPCGDCVAVGPVFEVMEVEDHNSSGVCFDSDPENACKISAFGGVAPKGSILEARICLPIPWAPEYIQHDSATMMAGPAGLGVNTYFYLTRSFFSINPISIDLQYDDVEGTVTWSAEIEEYQVSATEAGLLISDLQPVTHFVSKSIDLSP